MRGISWLGEDRLASLEGFCSMEQVYVSRLLPSVVAPYSSVYEYRCFERTCRLHLQGTGHSFTLNKNEVDYLQNVDVHLWMYRVSSAKSFYSSFCLDRKFHWPVFIQAFCTYVTKNVKIKSSLFSYAGENKTR